MMYSNKFVAAVKCGGKILREFDDSVYVPFGSEYSLLLKNLNNVKASVSVTIDGQDVLDGRELIVDANGTMDLERAIRAGNLGAGNRFKFVERTAGIEKHRGIKADDGLVRIEFRFEDRSASYWGKPVSVQSMGPDFLKGFDLTKIGGSTDVYGGAMGQRLGGSYTGDGPQLMNTSFTTQSLSAGSNVIRSRSLTDVGITVPGSVSDQKFSEVHGLRFETKSEVIVLRLLGSDGEAVVKAPVTVKSKPECTVCGRVNRATNKFCSECGAGLIIV